MYKKLLFLLLGALVSLPNVSLAWDAPITKVYFIQKVAVQAAERYGADRGVMLYIIENESHYNCSKPGDHGTSFGCAQIHLPDHPNISRTQAENIYFATDFLAHQLALGNCSMWSTCPLHGD